MATPSIVINEVHDVNTGTKPVLIGAILLPLKLSSRANIKIEGGRPLPASDNLESYKTRDDIIMTSLLLPWQ